jgi:hypothetical protein
MSRRPENEDEITAAPAEVQETFGFDSVEQAEETIFHALFPNTTFIDRQPTLSQDEEEQSHISPLEMLRTAR